jgi:gliding motility-associated-like protein
MMVTLQADHLTGGDMAYRCLSVNSQGIPTFEFTLFVYRDNLTGGADFDNPAFITVYNLDNNTAQNLNVPLIPSNRTKVPLNDLGPCARNIPPVDIDRAQYTFQVTLPPNQNGYVVVHQRCCRPGNITNLSTPNSQGSTYFARVTPEALATCNSNPLFIDQPPLLVCINSNFEYRFTATDTNGDSLVYRLCTPLRGGSQGQPRPTTMTPPPYQPVTYNAGFNSQTPFGQNVQVNLDPATGILNLRPDRLGIYTVAVCVDEYRNNRLIGTVSRDIQFNVADCIVASASASVPAPEPLPGVFASCKGQTVQFRNNSIDAQTSFWDFGVAGTNADTSRAREPIFTYPDSGTYVVTLIINRGQPCSDTTRITVRIFPNLDAAFTDDAVCQGTPVNFIDRSTSTVDPIVSWRWNFGSGNTSTEQNPTFLFNGFGTFPVKLVVETSSGCKDSITRNITIRSAEQALFTINNAIQSRPDTFVICTDTRIVQFTNNSGPNVNNLWSFGVPGATSTQRNPSYTFPDTGSYAIRLIVEPGTTCADTLVKLLRIVPTPQPAFDFSTECVRAPVLFTNNTSPRPYDAVTTFVWNFGDNTNSSLRDPQKTYASPGTFNVNLTVTTEAGCTNSITRPVTVAPLPVAQFTPQGLATNQGNFIQCEGNLLITFQNQSTGNNINLWDFGIGGAGSGQVSPSYAYPQAGNYNVKLVINPGRICTDSITKVVRVVNGLNAPNFNVQDGCVNTVRAFTNQTTAPLNDITIYRWEFGDGTTSTIRNPQKTYTLPGTYNVKMYVETAQGCKDSVNKQITIFPAPVPNYNLDQACRAVPIQVINNTTISSGTITSYNWTFGNGQTSTLEDPVISYQNSGSYPVILTVTSDRGCTATLRDTILIRQPSVPDFTFSNQCFRAPVQFTDISTSPYNDITQWNWTFEPGATSSIRNPSYTFSNSGDKVIKLVVTSSFGCRDSITKTINLKPSPIADFTIDGISGGPGIFIKCEDNFSVNFTNLSIDNLTNNWSFGVPGATSTQINPSYVYPDTGFFNVQLIINQGTLCADTVAYIIRTLPALTIGFDAANACVNIPLVFNNTSSTALNDINQVFWNFGDSTTSTQLSTSHQYAVHGTYPVTLIVGTSKGCLDTLVKNVVAYPLPIPAFLGDEACPGKPIRLINRTRIPAGSSLSNYEWNLGNGQFSSSISPTTTYSQPGLYNVTLTAISNFGCRDSIEDVILVRDFVVPVITQQYPVFCEDSKIGFSSELSTGIYSGVSWNFNNGSFSDKPVDSAFYANPGNYTITLTLSDSLCGNFSVTSNLEVIAKPVINLGPDFSLCPTLITNLTIGPTVYDTIRWSTGQANLNSINVNGSAGTVKVEVFEKGCYVMDSVVITPSCDVLAPAVFSPNSDGVNDRFNVLPSNVASYVLYVYNRWGQQVFFTNDRNKGWDGSWQGEPQPMDNYIYYAEGVKTDGSPFSIRGGILLLR